MKYFTLIFLLIFTGCTSNPLQKEKKPDEIISCGGEHAKKRLTQLAESQGLKMESMNSFTTLEFDEQKTKCSMIYKTDDLPQPEQIKYTVSYTDDMTDIIVIIGE